MQEDYNKTLNLPKTDFSMRAGLPKKEPEMLADWLENDLYEKVIANNEGRPKYVLHDGPPYANGNIHMGTSLNKVLKDIVVRYKNMNGFCSPYVPGYDTHGLPIELKALAAAGENKSSISKLELRRICKDFALKFVDKMSDQFQRLGVIGDFKDPYLTLKPEFEAKQIEVFGEMAKKGYIYKGLKAVYWCPNDKTALAEAEIEYADDPCDSIYVGFQVTKDNGALAKAGIPADKTRFVIWTTTTWTLPANVAICLGPDFDYVFVRVGDTYYVMAEALVEATMADCGITDYEIVGAPVKGSELELIETQHPFLDRKSLVILGDHVTLESGTGCVHTAPGHGVEDFEVCQKFYPQLPIVVPVDDAGVLTAEAGQFAGLSVWDANPVILKAIQESGHLLGTKHLTHQYPHCWRCHNPIIFRATEQWFCSIDAFKEETYRAIESVNWVPEWGKERMMGMVRDRNDWCISRQRTWGVPIPAFYCKKCGKYHITDDSIKAVSDLFRKEGSDAWYSYDAADILPAGTKCENCGGTEFDKDTDIMDVWFDSGSSHVAVLETRPELTWPCDLYLEGADQYRGWFQSSLLTSVACRGVAPYRNVLSCGWVVDGEGRKMSKSLGNGIEPEEIIKDYGADIIRLWVASSDYQVDVRISKEILKQLSEAYRKIRNTARFMIGNLSDFDPNHDIVAEDDLTELDHWALAASDRLVRTAKQAYDTYDFHKVYQIVHKFCVVDMSNFYLDVIKDRLYINKADSTARRAAQTAMFRILVSLTKLIAPVLAFTSQEIWDYVPSFNGKQKYVAMEQLESGETYHLTEEEWAKWDEIIAIRDDVRKALEEARNAKVIGASLEAKLTLNCSDAVYAFAKPLESRLAELCIVSKVTVAKGDEGRKGELEGLAVKVDHADGEKCARCWMYTQDVGSHAAHPTLCARCASIIES
ncbi:MAG: isoleucine--tRNA ligase [Pygmaiobacter sp.]|nr:isoleucine--tRNA ligase [Pygmaiobacter sp.]